MKRIHLIFICLVFFAVSCASANQQLMDSRADGLAGVGQDDGDWFLAGSHVLRLVYPFSEKDTDGVNAHIAAIDGILKRNKVDEASESTMVQLRAAAAKTPGTDLIGAMTAFNNLMTKDQIPTERGVAFYALGIAAGGLDLHTRLDSREGMDSLVPSIDEILVTIVKEIPGLPKAFTSIGTTMKTMIVDKEPNPEILRFLDALFAEIPRSK